MVTLYGKNFDVEKFQEQMNAAADSGLIFAETTIESDIYAVRNAYKLNGFSYFLTVAEQAVRKWNRENASTAEHVKLLKTIADALTSQSKFDQAQRYYDEALGIKKSSSLFISKAECYVAAEDIDSSVPWFRKAFVEKQDVHTAAKYAEILYLTGEDKKVVNAIISPFLESSLKKPIPSRSEAVILSLSIACSSVEKISQKWIFIQNNNGFNNSNSTIEKIKKLIKHFVGFDDEYLTKHQQSKFGRSFSIRDAIGDTQETLGQNDLHHRIASAYAISKNIWNGVYGANPMSKQDRLASSLTRKPKEP